MTQPKPNETIVMCIESGDSDCCIFGKCPIFQKCFPEAYADWQKVVAEEQKEKTKVKSSN